VPLPPAKEIVTVASHLPDFQEKKPRRLSEELIPSEKSWKRPRRSTPLSSKLSGPLQTATQTSSAESKPGKVAILQPEGFRLGVRCH
jgi:hypothetical protein